MKMIRAFMTAGAREDVVLALEGRGLPIRSPRYRCSAGASRRPSRWRPVHYDELPKTLLMTVVERQGHRQGRQDHPGQGAYRLYRRRQDLRRRWRWRHTCPDGRAVLIIIATEFIENTEVAGRLLRIFSVTPVSSVAGPGRFHDERDHD